ncbi:MAG TPA: sigma-70 family RNA polymerase sigma factor [Bryobacteraceae bacterium]|jgi:RNA polymerase sigma-70 factor (ECF subfamily)
MTQSTDDRQRVEAAQRDPARFGDLYEENFYRVYAYIVRRVGDRHKAEDLTADVFQEALADIGKFEWRGVPFAAWLLRIASRAVADHFKRSGRESGALASGQEQSSTDETERSAMLFELVERLPEAQFRVIHMRFVEQKSIREIAEALGRSEGAVKQLQLRALENLRAQMEGRDA